jgi:hypothetical protein
MSGGSRETVTTVTITLDWLMDHLPPPQVLKIDVEGAEDAVLAGASELIAGKKPALICEVTHKAECTRIFRSHGYTMYDSENRGRGKIENAASNTIALCEGPARI